jgi:hypothetical protein
MIALKLTPDRALTNAHVEGLATALHTYRPLVERVGRKGVDAPIYAVWEWHLAPESADALLWVSTSEQETIRTHLQRAWRGVTVTTAEDPLLGWTPQAVAMQTLTLREHSLYALDVDRRSLAPLPSLLETLGMLQEGERALVQIVLSPASPDWSLSVRDAYERLRKEGVRPKRRGWSPRDAAIGVAKLGATLALHGTALIAEVITGEETEPEPVESRDLQTADRPLSPETVQKPKYSAFDVSIRLCVQAPTEARQRAVLRALATSYRDLDADNALVPHSVRDVRRMWAQVVARKPPLVKVNPDYLSIPEAARLLQLPTGPLQEQYHLCATEHRESDLPSAVTGDGLRMGTHSYRGRDEPVYIPVDNWDELCLPRVVIGGMGTGKTKGFGGNFGAQALRRGWSVVTIDAAKDELGDVVQTGADPRKVIHLRFGEKPYHLDWCEATKGPNPGNAMAREVLEFLSLHAADAGIETARYLRLAAKTIGATGGSLSDLYALFGDEKKRHRVTASLREDLREQWDAFDALSAGMRGKVLEPVYNRLDLLLGDDYLRDCMDGGEILDFTHWLSGGYHVRIHLPVRTLGRDAVNLLADILTAKIELAMFARPESEQAPVFVIADEPHQYPSCAPRWERMAVESRKWRLGLVWMFHSFEQIPTTLARRIKDAGCHYHLYTSSKRTYQELREEMTPWTVEEALRTPTHSAIHVMRAGGRTVTPFMARMDAPPR